MCWCQLNRVCLREVKCCRLPSELVEENNRRSAQKQFAVRIELSSEDGLQVCVVVKNYSIVPSLQFIGPKYFTLVWLEVVIQ